LLDPVPAKRQDVVELGDEVVVELATSGTERFLLVDSVEALGPATHLGRVAAGAGTARPPGRRAGRRRRPGRALPVPHSHDSPTPRCGVMRRPRLPAGWRGAGDGSAL